MQHSPAFLALVEEVMPRIREMSIAEWKTSRMQLIDVREDHEWAKGHIPGATHLGRGILERDIEALVPEKSTPLVLYCGGGYRSVLAADNLQKMGYTNVYSLAGGWRAWNEQL